MKPNIIWISSYPKSGNTMVRLFLSAYFFTQDGKLNNFDPLKKITNFSDIRLFNKIDNFPNITNLIEKPELITKFWEPMQKILIKENEKIFFFKTHNACINYNSYIFTSNLFTKAFVYVVRDPRSVLVSMVPHFGFKDFNQSKEYLISDKHITYVTGNILPELLLSWKTNYGTWKKFKESENDLGLIIKYEDMIQNKNDTFVKILNFICKKLSISVDGKKLQNAIDSIEFISLQKMEKEKEFMEKSKYAKNFFRKGVINEWKENVPLEIIEKIENEFYNEMLELKYL